MNEKGLRGEMDAVKQLGEQIGYGNLISWASALWREDLRNQGLPERVAFIGVCECSIKESSLKYILRYETIYDSLVQKLKEE